MSPVQPVDFLVWLASLPAGPAVAVVIGVLLSLRVASRRLGF